jgi:hypothetical protein
MRGLLPSKTPDASAKLPLLVALANLAIRGGLMATRWRIRPSAAIHNLRFPPFQILAQLEFQAVAP